MTSGRRDRGRCSAFLSCPAPTVRLLFYRAHIDAEAKRQGKDQQKLLGHTDMATTRIYLRDREVEAVEGP